MKIESLKAGDTVFDVGRRKMGNTTISTVAVWPVRIIAVDPDGRWVQARWNCNPERRYYASHVKRWRKKEPVLVSGPFGQRRLATREEIKKKD